MRSAIIVMVALALLLGGAGVYSLARFLSRPDTPAAGMATQPSMTGRLEDVTPTPVAEVQQVADAKTDRGGQPLDFVMDGDVKIFTLTAGVVRWPILPSVSVVALAYNSQVPGPTIRVTQGDNVRIVLKNTLDEPTTIHWHGLEVPNAMDGVPELTQPPVPPGGTFIYQFSLKQAGTYMYHSHYEATQATRGLGGVFIVDPRGADPIRADHDVPLVLQEWGIDPRTGAPLGDMPGMPGMSVTNFFTINGKAFPATEPIRVKPGERVRLRLVNFASEVPHPIHLHGQPFSVVAKDGYPWDGPTEVTQTVASGETYDVVFTANAPGRWLLHCHVPHHTTNDGQEMGGMALQVIVEP